MRNLFHKYKTPAKKPKVKQESTSVSSQGALMRAGAKPSKAKAAKESKFDFWRKNLLSFRDFTESKVSDEKERIIDVVLIGEGPGNMRQKNFYLPQAIEGGDLELGAYGAVEAFNGAHAYIDHLDQEEKILKPEGYIRRLCGFYTDTKVITVKDEVGQEVKACAAKLHLDASEAGNEAWEKYNMDQRYRKYFSKTGEVYAGLSISNGVVENQDEKLPDGFDEWNPVVGFARKGSECSCDIVTRPARLGKFLEAAESVAFPENPTKEEIMKGKSAKLLDVLGALKIAEESLKNETDASRKLALEAAVADLKEEAEKATKDMGDGDGGGDTHIHIHGSSDGGDGDTEDEDEEESEDEKSSMEALRAAVPKMEDESDEGYEARLGKVKALFAKKGESESENEAEGKKLAKEAKFLREENRSLKVEKLTNEAKSMLEKEGIHSSIMTASDLLRDCGLDKKAWERNIARVKLAQESGRSRFTVHNGGGRPASEANESAEFGDEAEYGLVRLKA